MQYRRKVKVRKDPNKLGKDTKVHTPKPKEKHKHKKREFEDWNDLNWEDPIEHEDFSQG